jgi:CBS-domain-containing membrane protein
MRRSQVRRLPVVDAAGQILGIVTLADLARECAREEGAKKRDVRAADVSSTLSAICG